MTKESSTIKLGDKAYGIHFIVAEYETEPFADSLCFKQIRATPYTNGDAFKSMKEAVDRTIIRLRELHDE